MNNQSPRKRLPIRPSLEHLKKQAKRRASKDENLTLAKAQHLLANEYGCKDWVELTHMVETMLRGAEVLTGYKNDFDALPKAADKNDIDLVREILASGQFTQHDLDLALGRTVGRFHKSSAISALLLDHGADPDGQYGGDYGPIMFVTGECLDDAGLAFLIDAGADVSFEPIQTKYGISSPLGMFMGTYVRGKNENKHRGIKLLLENNAAMHPGVTPEILAIHSGDVKALEAMLKADPDLINKLYPDMPFGNTKLKGAGLLHCAMEMQEAQCIEVLLAHGADINLPAMKVQAENGDIIGEQSPMFHLVNAWGGHAFDLLKQVVENHDEKINWDHVGTFQQFDEVKGPISLCDWLKQNEKEFAMVNEIVN